MSHYDATYFAWQREIGCVGGLLNKFKFEHHINKTDIVLDFGCGGGFLLAELNCRKKMGIEVNRACYPTCEENGVEVHPDFAIIPLPLVDIVISNHALEHVPAPLETLKQLRDTLRVGGHMVIVVPCEQPHEIEFEYKENDISQHLHMWSPQSLGNLAKLAGLHVISCTAFQHKWVPNYKETYKCDDIHARCREYAVATGNYQVKLFATRTE